MSISVATVGDAIVFDKSPQHLKIDPRIRDIILGAEAAVVNMESPVIIDGAIPNPNSSFLLLSTPSGIDFLKSMGFNLFSVANNHMGDFLYDSIYDTIESLEQRDISYSGIGPSRPKAKTPAQVEAGSMMMSMVSVSTTYNPGCDAGPKEKDNTRLKSRPGVFSIGVSVVNNICSESFEKLSDILDATIIGHQRQYMRELGREILNDEDWYLAYFEKLKQPVRFRRARDTFSEYRLNPEQVTEFRNVVNCISQDSDITIASVHSHQSNLSDSNEPPNFRRALLCDCIRNGADIVVCHGDHKIGGVELYSGKPIFHGVGNFIIDERCLQSPQGVQTPNAELMYNDPEFLESILPVCLFENGELERIQVYPIDLHNQNSNVRRGVPTIADSDRSKEILKNFKYRSGKFDTEVEISGEKAIISTNN